MKHVYITLIRNKALEKFFQLLYKLTGGSWGDLIQGEALRIRPHTDLRLYRLY